MSAVLSILDCTPKSGNIKKPAAKVPKTAPKLFDASSFPTSKPIDEKLIIDLAKKTNCVITAEDHNIIGGLGSAVAEVLSENYPCIMKRIGVEDRYGESGKAPELYDKYGLSAKHIVEKVNKVVKKKK